MPLPTINKHSQTVTLSDGQTVDVHGLSRGEVMRLADHTEDVRALEVHVIACGTDTPVEDTEAWYDTVPYEDAEVIVNAIQALSKVNPDAGKA